MYVVVYDGGREERRRRRTLSGRTWVLVDVEEEGTDGRLDCTTPSSATTIFDTTHTLCFLASQFNKQSLYHALLLQLVRRTSVQCEVSKLPLLVCRVYTDLLRLQFSMMLPSTA